MSGNPIHFGNVVSRKPKKKLGSIWYCITKACSQPAYGSVCGIDGAPQRADASHAAHQAIANSKLVAPMKNISRCGASASWRGESPGAGVGRISMVARVGSSGGGRIDPGQTAQTGRGAQGAPSKVQR